MVHFALATMLVLMYFGICCVWSNLKQLNIIVNAATRQDLYAKLHSKQYIETITRVHGLMSTFGWSFVGGVAGALGLVIVWALAATNTVTFASYALAIVCIALAMSIYSLWQHIQLPKWVYDFGKLLTIQRGRLNVEMFTKRLDEVNIEIAEIKSRADDDSMSADDAGKVIRLAYERRQLEQTLAHVREQLSTLQ